MINFDKGRVFPSNADQTRIDKETQWERMFLSEEIYQKKIISEKGKAKAVATDPLVPIADLVCEINADLLFGEFPELKAQNREGQEVVDAYLEKEHDFKTDFLEGATYCSAMGTVFIYLFQYGGRVFHDFCKSSKMIWTEDKLGLTEVVYIENIEYLDKGKIYTVQRHYFVYSDDYVSPLLDDNRKHHIQEVEVKVNRQNEIVKTKVLSDRYSGYDFMPIYKVANIGMLGSTTGRSDLKGKEQLFAEIDARIDQINYALTENQDPWIIVPPGLLNQNGQFNRAQGKMIEKKVGGGTSDNAIDIASWDPQLEGAFKQIETMIYMVFFTSRISAPIAGIDKGSSVDSGRALKYKSVNTLTALNRRRLYWEEALKWYFRTRAKMDKEMKVLENESLIVEWTLGLPIDQTEIAENIMKQVGAGLLSHKTAMMKIHGYTEEQAKTEKDLIDAEKQAKADIDAARFRQTL